MTNLNDTCSTATGSRLLVESAAEPSWHVNHSCIHVSLTYFKLQVCFWPSRKTVQKQSHNSYCTSTAGFAKRLEHRHHSNLGVSRRRYEEPHLDTAHPERRHEGLIQGRNSEEIDNPCLVEVLLIRPLPRPPPRPPAEVRTGKGAELLVGARGAQANK